MKRAIMITVAVVLSLGSAIASVSEAIATKQNTQLHANQPMTPMQTSPPGYFSRYFFLGGRAIFMGEGVDAATFGFSFFGFLTSRLLRT